MTETLWPPASASMDTEQARVGVLEGNGVADGDHSSNVNDDEKKFPKSLRQRQQLAGTVERIVLSKFHFFW